jgi:hypothetical protein
MRSFTKPSETSDQKPGNTRRLIPLPSVPATVVSFDGQYIDTSANRWRFHSSSDGGKIFVISWDRLAEGAILTSRAQQLAKLFLVDKISRKKSATINNDFEMFRRFRDWLARIPRSSFDWGGLNEALARAFLAHGVEHTAAKGNDFCRLRTFYHWGVRRQYQDFDRKLLWILQSIPAAQNSKGHHVRFRDVLKGPFSPDELLLLGRSITDGQGADEDRALVMLHLELGLNPNASARLLNKDLVQYETKSAIVYHLDIPRVKKRTVQRETKRRPISTRLGQLLKRLQQGDPADRLLHWLWQAKPEYSINRAMQRFADAANLVSPRTQTKLSITARRFRFSIATHMAEEGASPFHIAKVLDHSDTNTVRVYVETVSSIADPLAKATDAVLKPLVRRFQGIIIEACDLAGRTSLTQIVPTTAPNLPEVPLDIGGVGICARDVIKHGLCGLLPPLSGYLCPSFAAFRGGPHQQMLDSIEQFLHKMETLADQRILRQLDDVRIAIRQVLDQVSVSGKESAR